MRIMDHKVLRKEDRSSLVIMVEQLRLWILMADNDLDITLATYILDNFLYWYENNGSQNFTKNTINSNNVRFLL